MSAFQDKRDVQIATIATLTAEIERLRDAAEKALHILQYCPDKQEWAVSFLSAALQPKEGEQ